MQQQERPEGRAWPVVAGLGLVGGLAWWLWASREAPTSPPAPEPAGAPPSPATAGLLEGRPELPDLRLAARASIAGTVKDERGRPIAGAQVCARTESPKLATSAARRAICARSGADGRYTLAGLFGARYHVVASAPGFIPATYARGEGAALREFVELRPGAAARDVDITLAGGGAEIRGVVKDLSGGPIEGAQVVSDAAIEFSAVDGSFTLWVRPGDAWVTAQADGYASGFDTGAAPGHAFEVFLTPEAVLVGTVVRAEDGAPIEGAEVTATGTSWRANRAITDAAGAFRIDGLEPGAYKPRAESDEALGTAEEQVILGLGETSEPIVIRAHPAFLVEGRIVVEGGGSCEVGSLGLQDRAQARGGQAQVEADGVVRLRGLLPGDYQVRVRCEGYVSAERYERVVIADRSLTGLSWQVERGQAIRGVIVDAAGQPVARVGVDARPKADPKNPRARETSAWSGDTDASGRFELAGLLPGTYSLYVASWEAPRTTPKTPTEVTLPAGKDVEGVRIELPATGEVRGVVRDEKGRPVAKAEVSLADGARGLSASAADDGSFRFEHVAAGEYRVTASRGWFEALRAPGTSDDDVQGEKVQVRTGRVATVELVVAAASGSLRGVVRDSGGGPVADAFIEATRESDSAAEAAGSAMRGGRWGSFWQTPHLTEPDGRFVLADLPDGKYTLRAYRKGGGEALAEHVEVGGEVALTIADTGRMSGVVALRGGGAPEEFRVSVEDERTGYQRSDSFLRTGGAWSLPEVPAGEYKIRVSAGAGTAETTVRMRAGEDLAGVRVELAPTITVRGKVIDLEGKPVPGMSVAIRGAGTYTFGGDEEKRNVSDAEGRFEVAHAPTGLVTIMVWPLDERYEWTDVPLRLEGTAAEVEVPPIQVAARRLKRGEAGGELGYTLKEPEPGADPRTQRQIVAVVRPGGAAAAAGLQVGDEIVSVDGQDVTGPRGALHQALTRVPAGTEVVLGLARGASLRVAAGPPL